MTSDELRGFDGVRVAVLFMLIDQPDEAWSRILRLDWRDARAWLGDQDGNGWFLDEELIERIRPIDDDLRDAFGRHVGDAQLFLSMNVSNLREGQTMTRTGLRIPRERRT